nr:immunoglobulin light chain junction region [Macaca mulatta]
WQQGNKHPYSF